MIYIYDFVTLDGVSLRALFIPHGETLEGDPPHDQDICTIQLYDRRDAHGQEGGDFLAGFMTRDVIAWLPSQTVMLSTPRGDVIDVVGGPMRRLIEWARHIVGSNYNLVIGL